MPSSPTNKQPTEVSNNPDSFNTDASDIQPEEVENNPEPSLAKTQSETQSTTPETLSPRPHPNTQATKSSRRNPLTWWRSKTSNADSNQAEHSPTTHKTRSIQESPLPSSSTSKSVLPISMTEIKLFAPLDTVGAENYLRYGIEGPRHYVMGLIESVPTPDDITIQLEIITSDSTPKFNSNDIQLKRIAHDPQNRTVWGIHYSPLHTHIIWIWDFFRMLSSIQLSVETPDSSSDDHEWTKLATTLQTLVPEDQLLIRVQNNVGTITQIHHVKS